jgi:hypothetical protein
MAFADAILPDRKEQSGRPGRGSQQDKSPFESSRPENNEKKMGARPIP